MSILCMTLKKVDTQKMAADDMSALVLPSKPLSVLPHSLPLHLLPAHVSAILPGQF